MYIHVHTCICMFMHVYIHVIHVYTCIYMYIHVYTCNYICKLHVCVKILETKNKSIICNSLKLHNSI